MCWILHKFEDIIQIGKQEIIDKVFKMSILEFYREYVEWNMYDLHRKTWSKEIQQQYRQTLDIDGDADVFINFLTIHINTPLMMGDIIDEHSNGTTKKLRSFTFNINPAQYDMIHRLESIREDTESFDERKKKALSHPTLGSLDYEHPRLQKQAPTTSEHEQSTNVPTRTVGDEDEDDVSTLPIKDDPPTDNIPVATQSMKDDRTGKDHIGFSEYAKVLAALIVFKGNHPFVFGILGQWGAGKVSQDIVSI
jgi:hypothetical protein